jgi:hypothetical protein
MVFLSTNNGDKIATSQQNRTIFICLQVSKQWKAIITNFLKSENPRVKRLLDQKLISDCIWGNPVLIRTPFQGHGIEYPISMIGDESNVYIVGSSRTQTAILLLNGLEKNIRPKKIFSFKNTYRESFKCLRMDKNYLAFILEVI